MGLPGIRSPALGPRMGACTGPAPRTRPPRSWPSHWCARIVICCCSRSGRLKLTASSRATATLRNRPPRWESGETAPINLGSLCRRLHAPNPSLSPRRSRCRHARRVERPAGQTQSVTCTPASQATATSQRQEIAAALARSGKHGELPHACGAWRSAISIFCMRVQGASAKTLNTEQEMQAAKEELMDLTDDSGQPAAAAAPSEPAEMVRATGRGGGRWRARLVGSLQASSLSSPSKLSKQSPQQAALLLTGLPLPCMSSLACRCRPR